MNDSPIEPKGRPLTEEELNELARIFPRDVRKAVAEADPSIKPYLEAESE